MLSTTRKKARRRRVQATRTEKLVLILSDGKWHSTTNLRRRIGPTFGHAKYLLIKKGIRIERRTHPRQRNQYQYRVDLDHPFDENDLGQEQVKP